jgi:peptidoglycan/xylan/chitin deacetylase (PgdA/CDA1 family)
MVFHFDTMKCISLILLVTVIFLFGYEISPGPGKLCYIKDNEQAEHIGKSNKLRTSSSFLRKEIPVLCYHNISVDGKAGDYRISAERFREHIKLLADSGYHTVLPDQLYAFITTGTPMPSRSVMLTFDDTHQEHYTIAAPVMQHYGFRGVFFIMTIATGKPGYLNQQQIKSLAEDGHVIGLHTWDHHHVNKLNESDWDKQVSQPKLQLEKYTGKPVTYFAYPSGIWDENSIGELKKRGVKAAFQLNGKTSNTHELYTIRRIIVPGTWSASRLLKEMKAAFK